MTRFYARGCTPNFMKSPGDGALAKPASLRTAAHGQHYDAAMSDSFFAVLASSPLIII